MTKKLIGHCAVDSGQLIVVDPCYLREWKDGDFNPDGEQDNHYAKACVQTLKKEGGGEVLVAGVGGTGVAFSTGYGDGSYPVYAEYGDEGRVKSITIKFF